MSEDDPKPERRRMVRPPSGGTPAGRNQGQKIKTAAKKSLSSQQWIKRQLADPWSEKARAEGWRSRAAFKLLQIDDRYDVIQSGAKVIDLGAAPGGWVQVAQVRGAGAVVGIDLLPIEPIDGATLVEGDFTDPGAGERLIEALGGAPDLVLSDMAHNTIGHRATDHLKIILLIEAAVDFALETLKPGGAFVTKSFQGGDADGALQRLKAGFETVGFFKPEASRKGSPEVYWVAQNRLR